MTLSFICIALLFGPGLVLRSIIRLQFGGFFPILLLSLAFFCLAVYLAKWVSSVYCIYLLYGLLSVLGIFKVLSHRSLATPPKLIHTLPAIVTKLSRTPEALIVASFALYYSLTGPYLEVPADLWNHLGAIRDYSTSLENGLINTNQPWYLLLALSAHLSGQSVAEALLTLTFVLQSVFLIGIASFVREVTRPLVKGNSDLYLLIVFSTLLTALTFGTSVFAFFSYYVLAPVFINLHLFFFASLLIFSFSGKSEDRGFFIQTSVLLLLIIVVSYIFHKQETLFIGILIWAFGAVTTFRLIRRESIGNISTSFDNAVGFLFPLLSSTLFCATIVYGIYYIIFIPGNLPPLRNNTLDISNLFGGNSSLLIADPMGRVLETVNLWGVVVVCFYFCFVQRESRSPALSAMAIAPYVILFTPFFSDPLLSLIPQDTLWRLSYVTPFGILASYSLYSSIRDDNRRMFRTVAAAALALIPLSPIQPYGNWLPSRYSTLPPIDSRLESRLWQDLLSELQRIGPNNVLTDPVTCYLVNALSSSKCFGFKFHGSGDFIPINYDRYGSRHFSDFHKWLLVINKRDGLTSENGRQSGHWAPEVMMVSKSYSPRLDAFLKTEPAHINLVWSADKIHVYEID